MIAVAKPVEVASISFRDETTTVKVGVSNLLAVQATDPFGNRFNPPTAKFTSLDTAFLTVDSTGGLKAEQRGHARVAVAAGMAADTAWVHGIQVVQSLVTERDTLFFHALGQTATINVRLLDDQGLQVADSLPQATVTVPAVVQIEPGKPFALRSLSNGFTPLTFSAGAVARQVAVVVDQRVAIVKLPSTSLSFDALKDTARLVAQVSDSLGAPLSGQVITYSSADTGVVTVDVSGLVTSRGNGSTIIYARASNGVADSAPVSVAQRVASVAVARDSLLFEALQAILPTQAAALDRLGSPVAGAPMTYYSQNSTVASVGSTGLIRAIANGTTRVIATCAADSAVLEVRVAQRPVRVLLPSDTMWFVALGETQPIRAIAVDSLGSRVTGGVENLRLGDTSVVQQLDATTLRSRANGQTQVTFTVAGLPSQAPIVVSQIPESIAVAVTFGKPIVTLSIGAPFPVSCQVLDRNGYQIAADPDVVSLAQGTVTRGHCSDVRVRRSGRDTLRVAFGSVAATVPVTVAAAPIPSSALGDFLVADSLPADVTVFWAPTIRLNNQGLLEVYFAGYVPPDSSGYARANLHRLISDDGTNFHYDGVALRHDDEYCTPQGQGIENIVILPRQDSAGFRMLYAAGNLGCDGWQVFSATSADGRNWTKEGGVRLPNGPPVGGLPTGEGMEAFQLPDGEWQLIVSTFERVTPPPINTWQITEWRSTDQLNWTYVGPVLTTRDLPPEGQGSVYSPTIREVAPGLWRMIFTADNRGQGEFQSQLWSAVSTDRIHWQIEGPFMGAAGSSLYYSSLAGDRLVFVRKDGDRPFRLAIATVSMP